MSNIQPSSSQNESVQTKRPLKFPWIPVTHNGVVDLSYLHDDTVWNRPKIQLPPDDGDLDNVYNYTDRDTYFYIKINSEPIRNIDFLVEECVLYPYLLIILAQTLPPVTVEKLCRKIFATKDLEPHFIDLFYTIFIPNSLKGVYSWLSLDLLIRASVANPESFKNLILNLAQNTAVPKNLLKDYATNIDATKKNEIMTAIAILRLTPRQFLHHLQTINILFQDSVKTTAVCEFVVLHLQENACYCYNNKDYGRLLLAYLTNFSQYPVYHDIVRKLIEEHCTEFKGPCETLFYDIYNEMLTLQHQLVERPRIFIDRNEEDETFASL